MESKVCLLLALLLPIGSLLSEDAPRQKGFPEISLCGDPMWYGHTCIHERDYCHYYTASEQEFNFCMTTAGHGSTLFEEHFPIWSVEVPREQWKMRITGKLVWKAGVPKNKNPK